MKNDNNIVVDPDRSFFYNSSALTRKMERWAKYFAGMVIIIAILALVGWQFNVNFLKRPLPELVTINPATAVSFIFCGLSFLLLSTKTQLTQKKLWGRILAFIILLIGLLQLISVLSGLNIPIDTVLFNEQLQEESWGNISNRMAHNSAFNFILSGIALLLLNVETKRKKMLVQIIALIIFFIVLLSIVGYLYRVNAFYGGLVYIPMAIHTAICFLFLSFAILFINPGKGIMGEFTSPFTGSFIARFLIPVAIIIPIVLGFLRLQASRVGIVSLESGVALLVLAIIIIFLALTWFIVVSLNKRDWLKQKTDHALRESEEQVQTIFNAAPDAVIVIDESGKIIKWNPRAETLFGWKENEVIGKLLAEIIIPERFREVHQKGMKHFLRTGEGPILGKIIETYALTKSGTELDVALNIAASSKIKNRYMFIGFVRDLTGQKKAEQKFKDLLNAAPDAMIIANEKGEIVLINQQTEILFGYTRDELIGKPVEILIPADFHNKHVDHRTNYFADPKVRSMGAGLELYAVRKDNSSFPVEISLSPLETSEGMLVSAAIRDITERKRAETQIQRQKQDIQDFIDSMSTLCAKITTNGELLMVNKTAMLATGLPIEELLNTNFMEGEWWTFDPEVHARVCNAFEKARSGTAINYDEKIFVFGQVLTINFSLIPILKPDGRVDYIVAEGRDITAQKKAEEKIKESEEKLSMLFNSMDEGFCIIEMIFDEQKKPVDYRFLVVNPSFEKQTGLQDAVGKRMREFAPNHEEHWFETYGRIALTGESIRFENRAEQLHRWYDVYAFRFGEPKNLQVAILFNDITGRKQTEETIRQLNLELEKRVEEKTNKIIQSEKKFRNLIENSTDIISLTDENFKLIYRSPSAERITGWPNEEREKPGTLEQTHPDDLAGLASTMKKILANPGKPFPVSLRMRHKQGHYIWLEGTTTIMLHDESIKAIIANMRDVTESKKAQDLLQASESRFRSIIEQFPYPVVTYTPDGNYTNANEAWEIMWKYKRSDIKEYNIRKDPQMIASGLSVYVEKAFAGEVATSEPYLYDPALIGRNSPKRWMQMTLYPLKNADAEILEVILILLDVTVNKESEESLRKSVREISDYKYALDESSIVAITDQKGIIKYVNDNFCKISKYSREELIGQDHRIINSGYHPKEFIRNLWVTIANGKIWKGELKNKAKDGTIYWVDTTIVPFLNEEGKPYQYIAIRADITERKQAEQALNESQQLLLAIIDNSTAVIYVKNLEGQYLLVNRRFSELFHLSPEAILGKTDYDFFSKEEADAFRHMDVRTAAADHALTEEEKVPQDDGLHSYISVKSTLRDDTGKPYAIFGISTDITELKMVEGNLRKSLREISDYKFALDESSIVAITDQKGVIKYVNNNFCKISKYSREELIGQDHRIINSSYHPKEFIRNLWETIANGKIWKGELKNKAKDGTIYWVDTTIIPFLNEEGKPYQYVAIRSDITGRKKIENEIQQLNEELEQKVIKRTAELNAVNKEMEAFTYSVSHDLRAPLRGIIGFTAILEEDYSSKLDKEARRITSVIKSNTLKMGHLIDDLLAFFRMGKQEITKTQINTQTMVNEIVDDLMQQNKRNININWNIHTLPFINADMNTLRQVWINLVSNAIKYSGNKKQPCIEIGSYIQEEETVFYIKDNGVGFDEQYKHKLFKVFQRLHGSEEFEGTGVGLALVEKIVSRHGGKVWGEGKTDRGACFYFSLPA